MLHVVLAASLVLSADLPALKPCSRCGPAPGYPSWECPDGAHQGGRGPCVELEDGRCVWLSGACPHPGAAACGPSECGSPPKVKAWSCPSSDETGGFDGCVREQGGGCGWAYRPCRAGRSRPAPRPAAPLPCRDTRGEQLVCTDEVVDGVSATLAPGGGFARLAWKDGSATLALNADGRLEGTSMWLFPRAQPLTVTKVPGELRLLITDATGIPWVLAGERLPAGVSFAIERIGDRPVEASVTLAGTGHFYLERGGAKSTFYDRRGGRCVVASRELFSRGDTFRFETDEELLAFLRPRCKDIDLGPLGAAKVTVPPEERPRPAPPPQDLVTDIALIREHLSSPDPQRVVQGCKLVRGKAQPYAVPALSDALTPLLVERLGSPDPEVRLWALLALRVLDGRALPALRSALEREQDAKLRQNLGAVIRQFEQQAAEEAKREAHPCHQIARAKIMRWPIRELCDPIGHYPEVLFPLGDGTNVYYTSGKECFRGRKARECNVRCLPRTARIATPSGEVPIEQLREGDVVWTLDERGRRVAAPLLRVGAVAVREDHELTRLVLADGRVVHGSGFHPLADGRVMGEARAGQHVDGSTVVEVSRVRYAGGATFDILPAGATGLYVADGVVLGSTLR